MDGILEFIGGVALVFCVYPIYSIGQKFVNFLDYRFSGKNEWYHHLQYWSITIICFCVFVGVGGALIYLPVKWIFG